MTSMEGTGSPRSTTIAYVLAAACTAVSIPGIVFEFLTRSTPVAVDFGSRDSTTVTAIVFMALPIVGALVAARRPDSSIGWLFIAIGATMAVWVLADGAAVYSLVTSPGAFGGGRWMAWVASWVWFPGWALTGLSFLVFPTGSLLSRRWRAEVVLILAVTAASVVVTAVAEGRFANYQFVDNPLGVLDLGVSPLTVKVMCSVALVVAGLPAVASLVVRRRRAGRDESQQITWVIWAASVSVFVILAFASLRGLGGRVGWLETWVLAVGVLVPISAGIAVLKYRLYGIDVVVNKTTVFGVLATFVTAVYVAVVVGVGALIDAPRQPTPGLSIIATAVVAVAFDPLRARARRIANRIVYGERATPYETLSALSASMATVVAADEMLPRVAEVVGHGVAARAAGVWLEFDGRLDLAAQWPLGPADATDRSVPVDDALLGSNGDETFFPLRHQGELLGAISVRMASGDHLDHVRQKLVVDLSRQAGLVVRNVRLINELRASRHRIVTAGDAERRRLERDLHDGAQQQLVALAINIGLAERLIDEDRESARRILEELEQDASAALANLRDLARGIYPPLLADQGLVGALEAQIAKSVLAVELQAEGVERYPQDIEVAVYFCCLEALQNVAKYARPTSVRIELAASQSHLSFAVVDDGEGFDVRASRGSGLQNMSDRVTALGGHLEVRSTPGGGTTVAGRLPTAPTGDLAGRNGSAEGPTATARDKSAEVERSIQLPDDPDNVAPEDPRPGKPPVVGERGGQYDVDVPSPPKAQHVSSPPPVSPPRDPTPPEE
jgi:signal transduction histidine kinase